MRALEWDSESKHTRRAPKRDFLCAVSVCAVLCGCATVATTSGEVPTGNIPHCLPMGAWRSVASSERGHSTERITSQLLVIDIAILGPTPTERTFLALDITNDPQKVLVQAATLCGTAELHRVKEGSRCLTVISATVTRSCGGAGVGYLIFDERTFRDRFVLDKRTVSPFEGIVCRTRTTSQARDVIAPPWPLRDVIGDIVRPHRGNVP